MDVMAAPFDKSFGPYRRHERSFSAVVEEGRGRHWLLDPDPPRYCVLSSADKRHLLIQDIPLFVVRTNEFGEVVCFERPEASSNSC